MSNDPHDIVDLLTDTTPRERIAIARRAIDYLKQGHCRNVQARTVHGDPVPATDPYACAWCILGAIYRATNDVVDAAQAEPRVVSFVASELQCEYPFPAHPVVGAARTLVAYNDRLKIPTETFIGVLNAFIDEQEEIVRAEELAQGA